MKTVVTEAEANRVAIDAVSLALQKLPYDAQDEDDRALAEHFLLKGIAKIVNSRLTKIEDKVKAVAKADEKPNGVTLSDNYRREWSKGEGRNLFSLDDFLTKLAEKYGQPKHVLKELSLTCYAPSAPPISIEVEYIGDVARTK